MFDTQKNPRSSNPNAPEISHRMYLAEKEYFTGSIITSILYGKRRAPHPRAHLSVLTWSVRLF